MARYVGFKIGKVHEEHVFSEYYCGGCGFPVTDHDSFCPECGGAFRESDADDDENAELRYKVHILEGGNRWLQILNDSLKVNNDNLRELVHDFALFAEDAVNKYGIELEAGHDVEAPPAEWKECLYELEMLVNRMRELGIEAGDE